MARPFLVDESYQARLESCRPEIRKILARRQPSAKPQGLYHYCSEGGLRGMISSDSLWLTSLRHMSDPRELVRSEMLARGVLGTHARLKRHPSLRETLLERLSAYDAVADAFAFCFSRLPDSPSQWHLYGWDGDGYVLEFDPMAVLQGFTTWAWPGRGVLGLLDPILYDHAGQIAIVRETADVVLDVYEDWGRKDSRIAAGKLDRQTLAFLSSALAGSFATFKDVGFQNESEFRLLRSVMKNQPDRASLVKIRPGPGERQYVVARPWAPDGPYAGRMPLVSVRHGPLVTLDRATRVVGEACALAGVPVPTIA